MNDRNLPVFQAARPGTDALAASAWRWMLFGQLWMLVGFTGMSLVVIAALSLFHGGAGHGIDALLATALAGALLVGLAWRRMARLLQRAEYPQPAGPPKLMQPSFHQ